MCFKNCMKVHYHKVVGGGGEGWFNNRCINTNQSLCTLLCHSLALAPAWHLGNSQVLTSISMSRMCCHLRGSQPDCFTKECTMQPPPSAFTRPAFQIHSQTVYTHFAVFVKPALPFHHFNNFSSGVNHYKQIAIHAVQYFLASSCTAPTVVFPYCLWQQIWPRCLECSLKWAHHLVQLTSDQILNYSWSYNRIFYTTHHLHGLTTSSIHVSSVVIH